MKESFKPILFQLQVHPGACRGMLFVLCHRVVAFFPAVQILGTHEARDCIAIYASRIVEPCFCHLRRSRFRPLSCEWPTVSVCVRRGEVLVLVVLVVLGVLVVLVVVMVVAVVLATLSVCA